MILYTFLNLSNRASNKFSVLKHTYNDEQDEQDEKDEQE